MCRDWRFGLMPRSVIPITQRLSGHAEMDAQQHQRPEQCGVLDTPFTPCALRNGRKQINLLQCRHQFFRFRDSKKCQLPILEPRSGIVPKGTPGHVGLTLRQGLFLIRGNSKCYQRIDFFDDRGEPKLKHCVS